MFKKLIVIKLIALYTVTAAGFGLNIHYCFNRVASVSFNTPVKNCGRLTKAKMKCCKESHLEVKVKDAHQGQVAAYLAKIFTAKIPALNFALFITKPHQQIIINDHYRGPPDGIVNNRTTFIKNRVFRI